MRKIKIKTSNFSIMFGLPFLLAPIAFIILAISMGESTIQARINSDSHTLSSKVKIKSYWSKDMDNHGGTTMYYPVFYYNVDGEEYTCSNNIGSSVRPNVKNSKIYYNSQQPHECISEYDFIKSIFWNAFILIFSLLLFCIGAFSIKIGIEKRIQHRKLAKYGQVIKNIPCRIIPSNATYKNKRGYIIQIEYNGLTYESDPMFDIDPRRKLADLLFDPFDINNYYVGFDII